MEKKLLLVLFGCIFIFTGCKHKNQKLVYPQTRMDSNIEDGYFGTIIKDPYRWLEDDNSEETKEWVDQQIKVSDSYLSQIPFRDKIKKRFEELMKYPTQSYPIKKGEYYFIYKNDGTQNQRSIYIKKNIDEQEQEILNPNNLSKDGIVSINGIDVSEDNKYLAYSISKGGSDWQEVYVKEIESKKDLEDKVQWIKFGGISWYKNGFFYSKYPTPKDGDALKGQNENQKIYYHDLGTLQEEDKIVFEIPEQPRWGMSSYIEKGSNYLLLFINKSTYGNKVFVKDLKSNKLHKIIDDFDNRYSIVKINGDKLFFLTDKDAVNNKLISIDIKTSRREDIIAEKDYVLNSVSIGDDKIICNYLKDAKSKIEVCDLSGKYIYDVKIPQGIASVSGFDLGKGENFTYYNVVNFTTPGDIYKYDIKNNISEVYKKSEIKFDGEKYETKQIFFESKDGKKIPMFVTHKKDLVLDGNRPTLIYGYGGFNISLTPRFSPNAVQIMENNGVYVSVNLRGGGEYGSIWHNAGTKMNKQNVFDDMISACEYMINNKYTNPEKLAINGGSNGGLLVGAVTNQIPNLIKVAIPQVGVMDMLRYQHFTIGRYWATDYGTSEDSKEMFEYLYKYSPLHNIKEGIKYPAVMVTTADHDDRVVPAHSFKYIAELQAKYKGDNPVIIRIDKNAGHGSGKPVNKRIEEYTDMISFIFYNMNEKI